MWSPRQPLFAAPGGLVYNCFMNPSFGALLIALLTIVILPWADTALAEYTLVLKNGRRITVQAYREEGDMIKFYGIGGEIGIGKDQVQSILKAGGDEGRGLSVSGVQSPEPRPAEDIPQQERTATGAAGGEPTSAGRSAVAPSADPRSEEERLAEERAKEEKEYQQKVKEITDRLRSVKDRYLLASRGSSSTEPTLVTSEEYLQKMKDNLTSRVKDAQANPCPADAGPIKLLTPSPFAGLPLAVTEMPPCGNNTPAVRSPTVDTPPAGYSQSERDFSDLRSRMGELVKERERLIEEMKQKNFETGDLFLD